MAIYVARAGAGVVTFEPGARVRIRGGGPAGRVFAPCLVGGFVGVEYDNGVTGRAHPAELELEPAPAAGDAGPDEARAILAELHKITSAPAPLEDCPFSLSAPKARGRVGRQSSLFEGGE